MQALADVLQARMQYMHESARDSAAAIAINALKSIRAKTKVAKKSSIKVPVEADTTLIPSYTSHGSTKTFCLRYRDSKTRFAGDETLINRSGRLPAASLHCFRFTDEYNGDGRRYIVVAATKPEAARIAREVVSRRALRYAGLAKRAIGFLMYKTNTKKVNDGLLDAAIETLADSLTRKKETVSKTEDGGTYSLTLIDGLDYALDAVKGGQAMVDLQLKKAINKITSVINRRLDKDFLSDKKLPTPFPEVRRKR